MRPFAFPAGARSCFRVGLLAVAFLFISALWVPSVLAAADPVTVLRSDENGVLFTVEDLAADWIEQRVSDARTLYRVVLPGFKAGGTPGLPELPREGGWVVLPPGTRPELVVVAEEWQNTEPYPLMVVPTPVLFPDPESGQPYEVPEILLPGEPPHSGGTVPDWVAAEQRSEPAVRTGSAVELGQVVSWRGRQIVSYSILPLQVDSRGRAARLLTSGTWEIRFLPRDAAEPAPGRTSRKVTRRGDGHFGSLFLNGAVLDRWSTDRGAGIAPSDPGRGEGEREGHAGQKSGRFLLAPEIKLPVPETRLYRVTAAGLQEADLLPPTGIQEDDVRLYQRRYLEELAGQTPPYVEIEVPLRMLGDGGDFSGEDAFLFWGLRARDDTAFTHPELGEIPACVDPHETYNDYNVYWLAAMTPEEGESWSRMETATLEPSAGAPVACYRRTDHIEEDLAYRERVVDIETDRNHFNTMYDRNLEITVPIYHAHPDSVDGTFEMLLYGSTNIYSGSRIVEVDLLNGEGEIPLGSVNVVRIQEYTLNASLAGADLQDSTVTIRALPTSFVYLVSQIDQIVLSYDAMFAARNNQLLFSAGEAIGTNDIEVPGFAAVGPGLIEVADPRQPVWIELTGENLLAQGDSTTLSLRVEQPLSPRTFFAHGNMTGTGVAEIPYELATNPSEPGDPTDVLQPPDLLVLCHPEFSEGILPWIEHKQARAPEGLATHLVEVDKVYDWFAGGLRHPEAIRRFVSHAIDNWGTWALQIVGDANENSRGLGDAQPSPDYFNEPVDWVPTHLHVQDLQGGFVPELLMSDDWFAAPLGPEEYPESLLGPLEMYVGRFPCNTVSDLEVMIGKVREVELDQADQEWRRTGIFVADDAFSYGTDGVPGQSPLEYSYAETEFQTSEDTLATRWERLLDLGLIAKRFFLSTYLDPFGDGLNPRDPDLFRELTFTYAYPELMAMLNDGAMLVHFQGHANAKLLCHEVLYQDEIYQRRDVQAQTNAGRPWIFFGMGCHISDFGQNPVKRTIIVEPCLGEKMLAHPGGGAVAVVGSSGWEFLSDNKTFSEITFDRWLYEPPWSTVTGEQIRSRWVLGELMWASEGDLLAYNPSLRNRKVVAQYSLLGDALLALDAVWPRVDAVLTDAGRDTVRDQDLLPALDESNRRTLELQARDEGGLKGVRVRQVAGGGATDATNQTDITDQLTIVETFPEGAVVQQRATYELQVPVQPFDHALVFDVYDTADRLPTDPRSEFTLKVPQTVVFTREGGDPVEMGEVSFLPHEPLSFRARVKSSANLAAYGAENIALRSENLELTEVRFDRRQSDPHSLEVTFTAEATDTAGERAVVLDLGGFESTYVLETAQQTVASDAIINLYNFPNPMADRTSFLFQIGVDEAQGQIQVFSISGRPVATVPVLPSHFGQNSAVVPWAGLDGAGDELANGVYFYRVELELGGERQVASQMQKLVIMR